MKISELKVGEMYVISPRVVFISNWVVGPKKHPLLKCWSTISPVEAKTGENLIPAGDRTFIYLGVKRTHRWEYMGITKNVHWALYQGNICVLDNWMGRWLSPLGVKENNNGQTTQ